MQVKVIGAGLAGVEAAYYLAENGVKVTLFDIKPNNFTPAHKSKGFAELVCSNSLKSNDIYGNACGLLKEEMRILGSLTISVADRTRVPAGNALAVNREDFSQIITEKILNHKNINFVCEEIKNIDLTENIIIATGPLTTDALSESIKKITGDNLFFFDAASPIVSKDSIDFEFAFYGDRYGKGNGDHVNCPMDKETYELFVSELINAEKVAQKDFENTAVFEGCMPVEVMASRGVDTLRFGTLKPVGLYDPRTNKRGYACLQLRREDSDGEAFNLVGFQTNLKFPEQKRVFGIIPALKNAEYLRYGVMHRNTYINAPNVLNGDFSLKEKRSVFFAGQITGVEGYVESAASGLLCGINMLRYLQGKESLNLDSTTVLGALSKHVSVKNQDFQPMNANFGILAPLSQIIKDKALKKRAYAERAIKNITLIKETL